MKQLVKDIANLCGYEATGLTHIDLAGELAWRGKIKASVKEYFSSCVPDESVDGPFHYLLTASEIKTNNQTLQPGCFVYPKGFITFAAEHNGDAVTVEATSGRVYVLSHEIISQEGISD